MLFRFLSMNILWAFSLSLIFVCVAGEIKLWDLTSVGRRTRMRRVVWYNFCVWVSIYFRIFAFFPSCYFFKIVNSHCVLFSRAVPIDNFQQMSLSLSLSFFWRSEYEWQMRPPQFGQQESDLWGVMGYSLHFGGLFLGAFCFGNEFLSKNDVGNVVPPRRGEKIGFERGQNRNSIEMKGEKNEMFWEIFAHFACVKCFFGSLFFRGWRAGLGLLGGLRKQWRGARQYEWDFWILKLILVLRFFLLYSDFEPESILKNFFFRFLSSSTRVRWCVRPSVDTETRYSFLYYFREVLIVKVTDFVSKSCSHSRTPLNQSALRSNGRKHNPYSNINFVVTFCFPFANFQQKTSKGFLR